MINNNVYFIKLNIEVHMAKDNSQIAMKTCNKRYIKELGYKSIILYNALLEAYGALVGLNTPPDEDSSCS